MIASYTSPLRKSLFSSSRAATSFAVYTIYALGISSNSKSELGAR